MEAGTRHVEMKWKEEMLERLLVARIDFQRQVLEGWKRRKFSILLLLLSVVGTVVLGCFSTSFRELDWKGWFTMALVEVLLFCLATDVLPTHVLFALALGLLVCFQCVDSTGALSGFSNQGVNTIGVLFFIAAAIARTNSLSLLARRSMDLGGGSSLRWILAKLCVPLGLVSMFLNCTPIYVAVLPVLVMLSKSTGIAPSKLMMPVSISLILGGALSIIGNSTNLMVVGLAEADDELVGPDGQPLEFGFFGITKVGSIYFTIGVLYVLIFAPVDLMLPVRNCEDSFSGNVRRYLLQVRVTNAAKTVVGRCLEEAGLWNSKGLALVGICRADKYISAPLSDTIVAADDVLVFYGGLDSVTDLCRRDGGLVPPGDGNDAFLSDRFRHHLYEASVSRESLLVGKRIGEISFQDRFHAVVLAVTHQDACLTKSVSLGEYVLEGGDTLILEANPLFYEQYAHDRNFSTVFPLERSSPPVDDWFHIVVSTCILVAVVAIPPTGVAGIWVTSIAGSILLLGTGCMSLEDAERAIDIPLMLTIALSFGVGSAVQQTGVANAIANLLLGWLSPLGPLGLLSAIYVAVGLLTEIITNNGAVAIFYPIVADILKDGSVEGLNAYSAFYVLILAGSATFITPIGHQLNLMAHSAGHYHYSDWARFGLPLQSLLAMVGVLGCYYLY